MKIFFSVGEPSGDVHGANLIRELKRRQPDVELIGYGGPEMASAGCRLLEDLTRLAVMWFARVIVNLHKFWHLVGRADRYFCHQRPDAVVLIDYPGFNWWIARRAKVHGIPVFYYGAPQIWGSAGWRIKKMRRYVDHILCKLPFETKWYAERGCRATYVGHPFFDEVRRRPLDAKFLEAQHRLGGPLVTILPGSRTQEVTGNLKWFIKAAAIVTRRVPGVRFAIAAFRPAHAEMARRMVAGSGLKIEVFTGRTPELIHLADCCMAVSGSVSLELLHHAKPTVILYWITRTAYFVQNFFRNARYITLVNLLTTDELGRSDRSFARSVAEGRKALFPEYVTAGDRSPDIAEHIVEWLSDKSSRDRVVAELVRIRERVGDGGASRRGAEYILRSLAANKPSVPRPHFLPDQFPATHLPGKRRDQFVA